MLDWLIIPQSIFCFKQHNTDMSDDGIIQIILLSPDLLVLIKNIWHGFYRILDQEL